MTEGKGQETPRWEQPYGNANISRANGAGGYHLADADYLNALEAKLSIAMAALRELADGSRGRPRDLNDYGRCEQCGTFIERAEEALAKIAEVGQ